jgi:hypothetical protein
LLDEPDEAEVSDEVTEARIRRSLGLMASSPPQTTYTNTSNQSHGHSGGGGGNTGAVPRRRFVRDGEVPVVILHPKSEAENRHATALTDMTRQRDTERTARQRAEQALHEAQALIQTLRTRIAHTEIAHAELARAEPAQTEPTSALAIETVQAEPAKTAEISSAIVEPAIVGLPAQASADGAVPVTTNSTQNTPTQVVTRNTRPRRAKPVVTDEAEEPTPVKWWR